jgi:quinol monooxygenase YgiN
MVHVFASIEVVAGKRKQFLTEFHRLVPLVRAEQGCIEYGPALDVPSNLPNQVPAREKVVAVIEKWATLDALRAHLVAPHMNEFRERAKDLVAGVQFHVLEPV